MRRWLLTLWASLSTLPLHSGGCRCACALLLPACMRSHAHAHTCACTESITHSLTHSLTHLFIRSFLPHFNTVYYSVHMLKVVLHLPLCACDMVPVGLCMPCQDCPSCPWHEGQAHIMLPAQRSFGLVCESSVHSPKHGVICALPTLQTTSDHTVLQGFKVAERCRNVA